MKKSFLTSLALAAVGTLFVTGSAMAQIITGAISYSSGADTYRPVDTNGIQTTLALADGINFLGQTFTVSDVSGDFDTSLNPGDIGNINDFEFDPLGGNVTPLWDIAGGGVTFSFDLETVQIDLQNASSLVLSGTGTLHSNSFDDTASNWIFTANKSGATFSWSGGNDAVPEPATMLLFGSGLATLTAAVRRRRNS